ncbi:hypothetical protein SAMN02746068_01389 [Lactococcus chungangensis CAU 28 = DSM 22330]|uniref:Uncharacterized protein n=1 Tax=Pseudolactococcus chungangensis CAU 28 = DSM 22330 TaxID=1122154 RepID=A0A1K2HDK3_9LACT|nr:hypothetical protein [Lactococcus chungangensis]SFZ74854.1 hypothetical protein SAMN02746068_01389 [Lactococcus chungangensis CAU 28 = DSM 22330]
MAVYIAIQFIPVANWLGDGALGIISFITGASPTIGAVTLVIAIKSYYNNSQTANELYNYM